MITLTITLALGVDDLWPTKSESVWLIVRAISFQDFQPICDHNPPTSQKDDMRSQYRASHYSASRGKNVRLMPTAGPSRGSTENTYGWILDVEEGLEVGEQIRINAGQRLKNGHARKRIFHQLRTLNFPMKTIPTVPQNIKHINKSNTKKI